MKEAYPTILKKLQSMSCTQENVTSFYNSKSVKQECEKDNN